jgi:hypothetical protein
MALPTPTRILDANSFFFLEVTDRDALQNIENKEVPCKIVQDKELRDVLASPSLFRLKSGA